jgi:hypothetical protein
MICVVSDGRYHGRGGSVVVALPAIIPRREYHKTPIQNSARFFPGSTGGSPVDAGDSPA